MSRYIIRLDDACEKYNKNKWDRIESILDKHGVKPLVGVIPNCQDPEMEQYEIDNTFWKKVHSWEKKGWVIAMHGYNHVYSTTDGGMNPVNKRSEFAGESLEVQRKKIRYSAAIFKKNNIVPQVFFAPSHTFDQNTLKALKLESTIRIISDTIANDSYSEYGFTFVPQQVGSVRSLPFRTVTFCYHPNIMREASFEKLDAFLTYNRDKFIPFPLRLTNRNKGVFDKILSKLYFCWR